MRIDARLEACDRYAVTVRATIVLVVLSACRPSDSTTAPAETKEVATKPGAPLRHEGFVVSSDADTPLDPAAVERLRERAAAERTTALLVARDGTLVVEEYFGHDPDRATFAMSVTKSVVALGIGALVESGALVLDEPLSKTVIPEWAETPKAAITLRHLMNHTSGIDPTRFVAKAVDWKTASIAANVNGSPMVAEPGSMFAYNNNAVDFLSVVVQRAHPDHAYLDDHLQQSLFGPLAIVGAHWKKDAQGQPGAGGELLLRPIDMLKLGQLVLDRGRWQGRQVVSEAWIDALTTASQPLYPGCGLLWWLDGTEDGIVLQRADGWLGQYIVVVPDARIVAVRTRDPRLTDWEEAGSWPDFNWDIASLAGHDIAPEQRNRFAPAPPR